MTNVNNVLKNCVNDLDWKKRLGEWDKDGNRIGNTFEQLTGSEEEINRHKNLIKRGYTLRKWKDKKMESGRAFHDLTYVIKGAENKKEALTRTGQAFSNLFTVGSPTGQTLSDTVRGIGGREVKEKVSLEVLKDEIKSSAKNPKNEKVTDPSAINLPYNPYVQKECVTEMKTLLKERPETVREMNGHAVHLENRSVGTGRFLFAESQNIDKTKSMKLYDAKTKQAFVDSKSKETALQAYTSTIGSMNKKRDELIKTSARTLIKLTYGLDLKGSDLKKLRQVATDKCQIRNDNLSKEELESKVAELAISDMQVAASKVNMKKFKLPHSQASSAKEIKENYEAQMKWLTDVSERLFDLGFTKIRVNPETKTFDILGPDGGYQFPFDKVDADVITTLYYTDTHQHKPPLDGNPYKMHDPDKKKDDRLNDVNQENMNNLSKGLGQNQTQPDFEEEEFDMGDNSNNSAYSDHYRNNQNEIIFPSNNNNN